MMFNSIKTVTYGITAATFLGAFALATPALAQDAAPAAKSHAAKPAKGPEETVETRIADLKAKLKITDAQSAQWEAVAAVMRDNAKEAQARYDEREAGGAATAIDDLKHYAAAAQGHADGLKKMEAAFEALYTSMSDDQKKNADMVFAEHEGRGHHGGGRAKK
jgi:periplasmic protein CpxP/Spy